MWLTWITLSALVLTRAGTAPRANVNGTAAPPSTTRKLTSPELINGVRWPPGTRVTTAQNGRLVEASILLSEPTSVGGVPWSAGTTVNFDTAHNAVTAWRALSTAERLDGVEWPAGAVASFSATGGVTSVVLMFQEPHAWGGVDWPSGVRLQADPSGRVQDAQWAAGSSTTLRGVTWPAGATVSLDPVSGLATGGSLLLPEPAMCGGVAWPGETMLGFDAKARITFAHATAVTPLRWHGKTYPAGTNLMLNPRTGDVQSAESFLDRADVK